MIAQTNEGITHIGGGITTNPYDPLSANSADAVSPSDRPNRDGA
jgi:hypothetical protein